MSEFLFPQDSLLEGGFRLKALDVFNWGTFDSMSGVIHHMEVDGNTALLVGMNGSGKSTLVDAILTLLVRPVSRNYNLASGAAKRERNERSYMKGAFGRSSSEDDSRARTQYLRDEGKHYTVILGAFENKVTGEGFTLLQILYLVESKVKKIYGFYDNSIRLENLLNGQKNPTELKQSLKSIGFKIAESYSMYFQFFQKATGVFNQAMDVFNQTVSVKDIPSLDLFIREHMLEKVNWEDDLNAMFNHFADLNKVHQDLVALRKQVKMLSPLVKAGHKYLDHKNDLEIKKAIRKASESYFYKKTVELFKPCLEEMILSKDGIDDQIEVNKKELEGLTDKQHQIKNELENAGGSRLREIPHLIKNEELQLTNKKEKYQDFHRLLKNAGIEEKIETQQDFQGVKSKGSEAIKKIDEEVNILKESGDEYYYERVQLLKKQNAEKEELEALSTRKTNLPEYLVYLRRNLCAELRMNEIDLPYAAELIAVDPEEISWLPSIEKVLRAFGMNLLVREEHYHIVSRYIDRTRLQDVEGKGQRLQYLRVSAKRQYSDNFAILESKLMVSKLKFKPRHPLSAWVENEIRGRFNFQCCESVEDFQAAKDFAMTMNCHIKRPGGRHEKDNRDSTINPTNFILGWDNKEKRRSLYESISKRAKNIDECKRLIDNFEKNKLELGNMKTAWEGILSCDKFSEINYWPHQQSITALQLEKRQIENSSDKIKFLKKQLEEIQSKHQAISAIRDEQIGRRGILIQQIEKTESEINTAQEGIIAQEKSGLLSEARKVYSEIDIAFEESPLAADNLKHRKNIFDKQIVELERQMLRQIEPLQSNLTSYMAKFLREFNAFDDRLDAKPEYFKDFEGLQKSIIGEGLPEHEKRFKERLNEKVTQEITLLNSSLNLQKNKIRKKIEQLNKSLKTLDYNIGSYMVLEAKNIIDADIKAFQQALKDCIEGQFKDSPDENEARYVRIAELVNRLQEEKNWCNKVTDVRRWFSFIARELDKETQDERNAYEDASGQSGGEKAKLAFTILVASVAYQYDIDPHDLKCNKFRFVVVDEMFSKVDDHYATYALRLFKQFGLQLLIVAPLDPKARITEKFVQNYFHVVKNGNSKSNIYSMTSEEFERVASD